MRQIIKEDPNGPKTFHLFGADVIKEIFKYLLPSDYPSVGRVCVRFFQCANTPEVRQAMSRNVIPWMLENVVGKPSFIDLEEFQSFLRSDLPLIRKIQILDNFVQITRPKFGAQQEPQEDSSHFNRSIALMADTLSRCGVNQGVDMLMERAVNFSADLQNYFVTLNAFLITALRFSLADPKQPLGELLDAEKLDASLQDVINGRKIVPFRVQDSQILAAKATVGFADAFAFTHVAICGVIGGNRSLSLAALLGLCLTIGGSVIASKADWADPRSLLGVLSLCTLTPGGALLFLSMSAFIGKCYLRRQILQELTRAPNEMHPEEGVVIEVAGLAEDRDQPTESTPLLTQAPRASINSLVEDTRENSFTP